MKVRASVEWAQVPPSLNQLLRMHWAVKRALRESWSWAWLRMPASERRSLQDAAKRKSKVKMLITLHNARQYDRDNAFGACKVIVDAAKAAGLIYDDRPAYLDLEVEQIKCKRADKHTTISLETQDE